MDIQIDTALTHLVTTSDPALKVIYECIDQDYTQCITDIQEGTSASHLIQQLKNIKSEISVQANLLMIDAKRIILPTSAIRPIMNRLHAGHAGQEKTLKLAQQLYYWRRI